MQDLVITENMFLIVLLLVSANISFQFCWGNKWGPPPRRWKKKQTSAEVMLYEMLVGSRPFRGTNNIFVLYCSFDLMLQSVVWTETRVAAGLFLFFCFLVFLCVCLVGWSLVCFVLIVFCCLLVWLLVAFGFWLPLWLWLLFLVVDAGDLFSTIQLSFPQEWSKGFSRDSPRLFFWREHTWRHPETWTPSLSDHPTCSNNSNYILV